MPNYYMLGFVGHLHYLDHYVTASALWVRFLDEGLPPYLTHICAVQYRQALLFYNAN